MIQCFDWEENTLNIETSIGIKFNLKMKGNKTIVCGDSATGKTLLCSILESYMKDSLNDITMRKYDTGNLFITTLNNKDELQNLKDKLIIIDRADLILEEKDLDIINSDTDRNKYLIFSRKPLEIYVSPNYYGEFKDKNGEITLKYMFDIGGWN